VIIAATPAPALPDFSPAQHSQLLDQIVHKAIGEISTKNKKNQQTYVYDTVIYDDIYFIGMRFRAF